MSKAGAEGKAVKRSGGGVRGGDGGHEWPSNLGRIRGVYTRSVAAGVAEVVVGAWGMGSKLLEAGGTSPPKPMPGVTGSIAAKPQAWMRWVVVPW